MVTSWETVMLGESERKPVAEVVTESDPSEEETVPALVAAWLAVCSDIPSYRPIKVIKNYIKEDI